MIERVDDAFVHAPATVGVRRSAAEESGGKSLGCNTGCGWCWFCIPRRAGDMFREFALLWSWWCRVACNTGSALRPTAQSGRGGSGCFEDVDVYVVREDVVDEDCETEYTLTGRNQTRRHIE